VNLYQVFPADSKTFPLTTPDERAVVSGMLRPSILPWVRAIMVTNSAGDTVDATGSSRGLSLGADRTLLGLYREAADIVLVGASTIRSEPVPTPRHSALAIVSASGNLEDHKLVPRDNAVVFLVTTQAGAARAVPSLKGIDVTPVIVDSSQPFTSSDIFDSLAAVTTTDHVLVEGGRRLWETLADVTDEVCIAVTPPPLDSHAGIPSWWPNDTATWTLSSLLTDDDKMLYYRYLTDVSGAP